MTARVEVKAFQHLNKQRFSIGVYAKCFIFPEANQMLVVVVITGT